MDNNNINSLINGIGAFGEVAGILVASLTKNGFTRSEAVSMTKDILIELIKSGMRGVR